MRRLPIKPAPALEAAVVKLERRVVDALRRGAYTYTVRSGTKQYTFRKRTGGSSTIYAYVKDAYPPVRPEVEELARRLRAVLVCRRHDCRKTFTRRGRKEYCSPACATTARTAATAA